MQDTSNRAKTHRQSRRTGRTKRTRTTTDTLQLKEQKLRKQNFMWLICKWIYKTSMLEVMRLIFSLRIVFKITILLSQKWKWLLLIMCITHWSLHSIRVKDFWVNSVGRNAASVTKRRNRSQICLMGNVSEMGSFSIFSKLTEGETTISLDLTRMHLNYWKKGLDKSNAISNCLFNQV